MGYSLFINCKTQEDVVILEKHMRNYIPLCDISNSYIETATRLSTDLSYTGDYKRIIGFDYSSWIGDEEHVYIWTLCHYMSEKVDGEFVYDGCEFIEPENWKIYLDKCLTRKTFGISKRLHTVILTEIERLNNLWEKEI